MFSYEKQIKSLMIINYELRFTMRVSIIIQKITTVLLKI